MDLVVVLVLDLVVVVVVVVVTHPEHWLSSKAAHSRGRSPQPQDREERKASRPKINNAPSQVSRVTVFHSPRVNSTPLKYD